MELPKRKGPRLRGYDYSTKGAYFITICTHNRQNLFSRIVGAIHESPAAQLTPSGRIVDSYISDLEKRYGIVVDKYVIMPNHIHLILIIDDRAIRESPLQRRSVISNAIGYLKMNASRDIHKNGYVGEIWQRSYHDHIIRGEKDYLKIWEYIENNPKQWEMDCFYVEEGECT